MAIRMRPAPRFVAVVLAAALLAAAPLTAAPAAAQGGDTTAVAINTRDGASVFRLAFQVRRVAGSVVDQTNAAVAYASCSDCETIAISLQVVLAMGDVEDVSPENYALAVNVECDSCTTLAGAYQFVIGTDGPARFTAEGNRTLADIRRRLLALRDSELDADAMLAELDAIAADLRRVLREEMVQADDEGRTAPDPAADASPSPDPSRSPAATTAAPTEAATDASTDAEATPEAATTSPAPAQPSSAPAEPSFAAEPTASASEG